MVFGRAPDLADTEIDGELLRDIERLLAEPDPRDGPPASTRARLHAAIGWLAFELDLPAVALEHARRALADPRPPSAALRLLAAANHRNGQLSEAIAAWDRLAASATAYPTLHLLALLYEHAAARDADRRPLPAALERTLGTAAFDLVRSCRAALDNDLGTAVHAADRVFGARARPNPTPLKVAAIQRAWVLERAHDITGAIASLERLADEPGLATDAERLLCLSVLYEREGTPERIRRALRAVRFAYAKGRDPSLLRRIARLLRALGHDRVAALAEARFERIFRRLHGELSPSEIARAASSVYVPLRALRRLDLGAEAARRVPLLERRRRPEHRRRAAVLALATGDWESAVRLLAPLVDDGAASAADASRLADALEALGRADQAQRARVRAVNLGVEPLALTELVSGLEDLSPAASALVPASIDAWREALSPHVDGRPGDPDARRALASVERAAGRHEQAQLHEAAAVLPPRAGTVTILAAAALRRGGDLHGLVHELWVERVPRREDRPEFDEGAVLGSVSEDFRAGAVNVFYGVRAFAERRFAHRIDPERRARFLLKVTKDDEVSSGQSAELPIAIALFAALTGLEIPGDLAATGALVCEARGVLTIGRVGDIEAKVLGAYERRARILVPAGNAPDVERAERIPSGVVRETVRYVKTFEEVAAELRPARRE